MKEYENNETIILHLKKPEISKSISAMKLATFRILELVHMPPPERFTLRISFWSCICQILAL